MHQSAFENIRHLWKNKVPCSLLQVFSLLTAYLNFHVIYIFIRIFPRECGKLLARMYLFSLKRCRREVSPNGALPDSCCPFGNDIRIIEYDVEKAGVLGHQDRCFTSVFSKFRVEFLKIYSKVNLLVSSQHVTETGDHFVNMNSNDSLTGKYCPLHCHDHVRTRFFLDKKRDCEEA